MADKYYTDKLKTTEDISPAKAKGIIKSLNQVKKPEEITAIMDIGKSRSSHASRT